MHKRAAFLCLIVWMSLGSATAFADGAVVTDATIHRIFEDSPEVRKLHDIMIAQRTRIRALMDAFMNGDTESIRRETDDISAAMQAVSQVYSMSGKSEADTAAVWKDMSGIISEAEALQEASSKNDYKSAYRHFYGMTAQCISCHQQVREWGKFPEPDKTAENRPKPASLH